MHVLKYKITSFFYLLGILSMNLNAQIDTTLSNFGGIVYLDSLVVTANKQGFDVADFIDLVIEDESFYTAFRNIRFLSYASENEIQLFNKKGKEKAAYQNSIRQISDGKCRTMDVISASNSGNFYKRKNRHRYYTAKMHDLLFHTHQKTCDTRKQIVTDDDAKGIDKHIAELKKLVFKPGKAADIPLIGDKTAIFSEEMTPYYDFSIRSKYDEEGNDCYVFSAVVKTELSDRQKGKTVIKSMETYFEKNTFQVVARNYRLAHSTPLFDFDVSMDIRLTQFEKQYVPSYIFYDGQWDIPGKIPEIAVFEILFSEYKNPSK